MIERDKDEDECEHYIHVLPDDFSEDEHIASPDCACFPEPEITEVQDGVSITYFFHNTRH